MGDSHDRPVEQATAAPGEKREVRAGSLLPPATAATVYEMYGARHTKDTYWRWVVNADWALELGHNLRLAVGDSILGLPVTFTDQSRVELVRIESGHV